MRSSCTDAPGSTPSTANGSSSIEFVVDPGRPAPPPPVVDDVAQRTPAQRTVTSDGNAERDARRQRDVLGNGQQLTQLRLDRPVPHRERTAVAERPRREQQVLAGRV